MVEVVHDKDNNIILLVTQVVTITYRLDGRMTVVGWTAAAAAVEFV